MMPIEVLNILDRIYFEPVVSICFVVSNISVIFISQMDHLLSGRCSAAPYEGYNVFAPVAQQD